MFEETIKDIHQKEPTETSIQTLVKVNLTKIFTSDIENQLTKPISLSFLLDLLMLPILPTLLEILMPHNLLEIPN